PPPPSPLFPYTTLFRSPPPDHPVGHVSVLGRICRHRGVQRRQDLLPAAAAGRRRPAGGADWPPAAVRTEFHARPVRVALRRLRLDRKSTRLNSSHVSIS